MKINKYFYSLWWIIMALSFALPIINLWLFTVWGLLCSFANFFYANNIIVRKLILVSFLLCSMSFSVIAFLSVGFFCVSITWRTSFFYLIAILISILNYVVTIFYYRLEWSHLLWFVVFIHLFFYVLMYGINVSYKI